MKRCILQVDKVCNDCGTCDDRCELDPAKVCDNCFRCLDQDTRAYAEIPISGVYLVDDFTPERVEEDATDSEESFVPNLFDDWKEEEPVEAKTLPMTYGARARRAHTKH